MRSRGRTTRRAACAIFQDKHSSVFHTIERSKVPLRGGAAGEGVDRRRFSVPRTGMRDRGRARISRNKEDIKNSRKASVALPFSSGATCVVPSEHVSPSPGPWVFCRAETWPFAFSRGIRKFQGENAIPIAQRPFGQNPSSARRKKRACNYRETPPPTHHPSTPANRSLSILAPFFRRTIRIDRPMEKKLTN